MYLRLSLYQINRNVKRKKTGFIGDPMNLRTQMHPHTGRMRQIRLIPLRIQQGHNTQLSIEVVHSIFNFVLAGILLRGNKLHNSSRLGKRIAKDGFRIASAIVFLPGQNEHTSRYPIGIA